MKQYLAFDLGATSGRAIAGQITDNELLSTKEIHRFQTGMVQINDSWHWNIFGFFSEMKFALKKINASKRSTLESIAVDTWGVDFGLITEADEILGLPHTYRDSRTDGVPEAFFELLSRKDIYNLTGIEVMQFNTLYQLYSMAMNKSKLLECARSLLFIPDLFNYLFTGVKTSEFSFATTSQMFNPKTNLWEKKIISCLGVHPDLMNKVILPGTRIASLRGSIASETNASDVSIVSTVSHDTGAAVAAIPAEDDQWAYISSGTWSLMGVESDVPVINDKTFELNFSNEGGMDGKFCLQKTITGLWLLEQYKQSEKELKHYDYERIIEKARQAPGFISVIDPCDPLFLNPVNMGDAIVNFLMIRSQKVPNAASHTVRLILESLAFKYRQTLEQLRLICAKPIQRIHIIGGGARNDLLNQFTANATGLPVIAGPYEGTAIGNIIVQAIADKQISDIGQGRQIIKKSVKLETYTPENKDQWESAYHKYLERIKI